MNESISYDYDIPTLWVLLSVYTLFIKLMILLKTVFTVEPTDHFGQFTENIFMYRHSVGFTVSSMVR